ncbi:hypothetical protein GCM10009609_04250 [Pseudonocardia aurantiaca]
MVRFAAIVGAGVNADAGRSGSTGMIGSGSTNGVTFGLKPSPKLLGVALLPLAHALSPCWVTRKPPPVSRAIVSMSRRFNPAAISS